jgi:hypothetical protein
MKGFLLITLVTAFTGCVKDNEFFQLDNSESNRKQIVKIPDAANAITIVSRDANPPQEEFEMIQLTRSPNDNGQLNQALTVKLAKTASLIPTGYVEVPANAFEIVGGTDVTFQAGEVVKAVRVKVDKSKLDLSNKYAVAFQITDAGSAVVSRGFGQAVYEIGIKNEWHGEYHATGVFTHPTAGPRDIDEPKNLQTVGPRAVRAPLGDLGGSNYYMILTVNANNTVTITPSGITPNIDQSWGPNTYDPTTKTFNLHYSYNTAAPRIIQEAIKRK